MKIHAFIPVLILSLTIVVELRPVRIKIDFGSHGKYGTYIRGHRDGDFVVVDSTSKDWVRIGQDNTNVDWRVKQAGLLDSYDFIISNGNYYGNGASATIDQIVALEGIRTTNTKITAPRTCVQVTAKCPQARTVGHRICGEKKIKHIPHG